MEKILCYGDSNTFGFNPLNSKRFDENECFSGILKNNLKGYFVTVDGLNNRTAFSNCPLGDNYCGFKHLKKILNKNEFDILILALGTNDLQFIYDNDLETIEKRLNQLIDFLKENIEEIIIIPPVLIGKEILTSGFSTLFNSTSIEKSKQVQKIYKQTSKIKGCFYFDVNEIVKPSAIDGLHYEINSHKIIADNLSEFILNLNL